MNLSISDIGQSVSTMQFSHGRFTRYDWDINHPEYTPYESDASEVLTSSGLTSRVTYTLSNGTATLIFENGVYESFEWTEASGFHTKRFTASRVVPVSNTGGSFPTTMGVNYDSAGHWYKRSQKIYNTNPVKTSFGDDTFFQALIEQMGEHEEIVPHFDEVKDEIPF